MRRDSGSGSVLSIASLGLTATVLVALLGIGEIRSQQEKLQRIADLAAIAASQTLRGLNTGIPCRRGEQILTLNMAKLAGCSIVGDEATLAASTTLMGIVLNAAATAVGE